MSQTWYRLSDRQPVEVDDHAPRALLYDLGLVESLPTATPDGWHNAFGKYGPDDVAAPSKLDAYGNLTAPSGSGE